MDVIPIVFGSIRIILGFFLLLFVPGYTISLVFFPYPTDIRLVERLVYSIVLSIGSVIVLVLFMDVILGMNTTPRNITIIICVFAVFALILWHGEKKYGSSTLKLKIDSMISMDYYTIQGSINKMKKIVNDRIRGVKRIITKKDF